MICLKVRGPYQVYLSRMSEKTVRRIAIVQGHPDPAGKHLCHALADAYADGAARAGHAVDRKSTRLNSSHT